MEVLDIGSAENDARKLSQAVIQVVDMLHFYHAELAKNSTFTMH